MHTSTIRWSDINSLAASSATKMMEALNYVEEVYQDLLEVHTYAGGTVQGLADQLFYEVWTTRVIDPGDPLANPVVPPTYDSQANAAEVAMTQDAIDTMTALHNLYQAASNVAVSQADRIAALRRFT